MGHPLKGRTANVDGSNMADNAPQDRPWGAAAFLRFSLPVRLALLSLVFAIPIFAVSYASYANVLADVRHVDTEEQGARFDAAAVRLIGVAAELPAGKRVSARQAKDVDIALKELDDRARVFEAAALETHILLPVRRAWPEVERGPTGATLDRFQNALLHAASIIADASQLTFDPNIAEGNLQDAQFSQAPVILQHLAVAGTIAELDRRGRFIPVRDRIAIAQLIAESSSGREPLATDMLGLFRSDPSVRPQLEPLWRTFTRAANALEAPETSAMNGSAPPRALPNLEHRLVVATTIFSDALRADLLQRFVQRREKDRAQLRKVILIGILFGIAISGLLMMLGRSIIRRDRRELLRAQADARTLAAELARRQAERALSFTEAQFRAILDRSNMGIALLDESGATVEANDAVVELLGSSNDIVSFDDAQFQALVSGSESSYIFERSLERSDGSKRWAEVNVSVVSVAHPSAVVALAMVRDITERKAIDDRLRYAATHDQVTALPNRPEFLRHLEGVVAERIATGRNFAVLFIDLDDFKLVNDRLGHHAGDRLLIITARRLLSLSRAGDIVARFHGDEFAILLRDVRDLDTALAIADRVQSELRAPVSIDGGTASVTSSIGIVMGNDHYIRAEDVIRHADAAMYHAKSLGRSTAVVFDEDMQQRLVTRMRLVEDLAGGLARGEFRLAYQPVVDLVSGCAVGFEALMRWDHPLFGSIAPATFIPLAEESGAIIELGRFALRQACAMLSSRMRTGYGSQALSINVNLAVRQVMEPTIVRDVQRALAESGLRPDLLMLEITESALLEDGPRAVEVLGALKNLGVRLCIDDFGTGYSSLRYLHQFPIDALKIDRSFVNGRDGAIANEPIVQMVITLAHSLGMDVVAEGIESQMQREKLSAAGCMVGQGFFFARPIDRLEDLDRWFGEAILTGSG